MWKRSFLGLLLAAVIIFLLARRVDVAVVLTVLSNTRLELLAGALGAGFLSAWLKGERWSLAIAAGERPRPRKRLFSATIIGVAGNTLLPARLGDLARVLVFRKHNDVPAAKALIASWAAQLFDLLAVAMLLLIAGSAFTSRRILVVLFVAIIALLALLAIAVRRPDIADRLERRVLPRPIYARLSGVFASGRQGLRFLNRGTTLTAILGLTLAIWVVETLSLTVAFWAFGLHLGLIPATLLAAAIGLSFALPLTPGNVGTYQLVCIMVLGAFGTEREAAFAFGLGYQAVSLLVVAAAGLLLMQREGMGLRSLAAMAEKRSSPPVVPGDA